MQLWKKIYPIIRNKINRLARVGVVRWTGIIFADFRKIFTNFNSLPTLWCLWIWSLHQNWTIWYKPYDIHHTCLCRLSIFLGLIQTAPFFQRTHSTHLVRLCEFYILLQMNIINNKFIRLVFCLLISFAICSPKALTWPHIHRHTHTFGITAEAMRVFVLSKLCISN